MFNYTDVRKNAYVMCMEWHILKSSETREERTVTTDSESPCTQAFTILFCSFHVLTKALVG